MVYIYIYIYMAVSGKSPLAETSNSAWNYGGDENWCRGPDRMSVGPEGPIGPDAAGAGRPQPADCRFVFVSRFVYGGRSDLNGHCHIIVDNIKNGAEGYVQGLQARDIVQTTLALCKGHQIVTHIRSLCLW